jgi:hypothetical protein
MATVMRPAVLAAVYEETLRNISSIPTMLIAAERTIYRSVPSQYLPQPPPGGHVSKAAAGQALRPRDGVTESNNRFSGPSYSAAIRAAGAIYCVLQQQALVNEVMHYGRLAGVPGPAALVDRCVIQIVLMRQLLVADLSPHNAAVHDFIDRLQAAAALMGVLAHEYSWGGGLWQRLEDSDDCSVARGIALAVARSGFPGLSVQTVRKSERSAAERGDNLVLFGTQGQEVQGVYVDQALYFTAAGIERFPVQFP